MREIKFRGKKQIGGEWVQGNLIQFDWADFIVSYGTFEARWRVIPETIGQYTGLKDKEGKEIFEGDIVKTHTDKNMVIGWSERFASFVIDRDGWAFCHWFGESMNPGECSIIGNLHDNPELLK